MNPESTTPEERAASREALVSIMDTNMRLIYTIGEQEHGGVTIDHAVNGAVAMFEFGLVLAERHPELAAMIREASRERDEDKSISISTAEAVDAVVRHHERLAE